MREGLANFNSTVAFELLAAKMVNASNKKNTLLTISRIQPVPLL